MNFSEVRCVVCDSVGKWKNVDQYRYKPENMCMCTKCGFVTYPEIISKPKDLTEYYREDYRDGPKINNIYTGERKLHYHAAFLHDLFTSWKKEGLESPKVFEVGAAFGMCLNWMREIFPKGDFSGSELTRAYVRNAWWMYKLKLTDKIDTSKKYDLIVSYKVAEHQDNIDKELRSYAESLSDKGFLYISVPTWFESMSNFGAAGFNVEYYYHKNHINCWTRNLFEKLLAKSGLEIVKSNHQYYDDTYLCKRNDALMDKELKFDNPDETEKVMAAIKEAAELFDAGNYDKAIERYPNFPEAWSSFYEGNRSKHHKNGFDWIMENVANKAVESCPDSAAMLVLSADICMRYSRWDKAIEIFERALKMKPNDNYCLLNISHCLRQMSEASKDPKDKDRFLSEARNLSIFVRQTSLQSQTDATNWMMMDNSKLRAPHESEMTTVRLE